MDSKLEIVRLVLEEPLQRALECITDAVNLTVSSSDDSDKIELQWLKEKNGDYVDLTFIQNGDFLLGSRTATK